MPAAAAGGLWHVQSGTQTPWGSHLAAERLPLDCRAYEELFAACDAGKHDAARTFCGLRGAPADARAIEEFARYYGLGADVARWGMRDVDVLSSPRAHAEFVKRFKCYNCERVGILI